MTTGQYLSYQTFSNLQFEPLLKFSSDGVHSDLRDTNSEKTPFVFVRNTRVVLMFRDIYNFRFQRKRR